LNDFVQPTRPPWATQLLETRVAQRQRTFDVDRVPDDDRPTEAAASVSAVIPFLKGEG
jgi:hypothetical protein